MSLSDTEKIKERIAIEELIGEYVQLKVAGTYHKGLCPFHNEKTPSFTVNKEKDFFHCFGCGKNGDIFTFIQEIEGMDFPEALRYLANRAGVELEYKARSEVQQNQKNRIKDINAKATFFYHNVLVKLDMAKEARDYLKKRGITDSTIVEWNIGFVPDQWELLTKYLLKKGCGIDDLVASGLTVKKEQNNTTDGRGYYDRFRGRIMFPINNTFGDVVGFTGRILIEHEKSGGKYVNTPQTSVYDKSRVLFGLDKAKKAIKQVGYAVIVEGQMDVIACHQAGICNVIASSGTALTEEQIKLLSRYTKEIRMAFDADDAGRAAAKRGIDIAIAKGMQVKVIQIPEGKGKDPDECIQQDKQVWLDAVDNATEVMKWYFVNAFRGKTPNTPRVKQEIADEILTEIANIPFAVEKDHWIQELAGKLGIDASVLREDLQRISQKHNKKTSRSAERQKKQNKEEQKKQLLKQETMLDRLAWDVLALVLHIGNINDEAWKQLPHDFLSTQEKTKKVYECIKTLYSTRKMREYETVVSDSVLKNQINILLLRGHKEFGSLTPVQKKHELTSLSAQLKKKHIDTQKKDLEHAIARAKGEGDTQKEQALLEEFQRLISQ